MPLILTIENGPQPEMSGKTWRFGTDGGTMGRNTDCDLVLPDPKRYTSSLHAEVEYDQEGFKLTDRSTNGTYHNSPKTLIGKNRSVSLDDGDRVFIGDFVLRVDIENDQDDDAPADPVSVATSQLDPDESSRASDDNSAGCDDNGKGRAESWDDGGFSLPWDGDGTEPGDKDDSSQADSDDQAQSFSQSPEREYFSAPSASPSDSEAIPDDWDDFLTGFHDAAKMQKPASESADSPDATPRPDSDSARDRGQGDDDGGDPAGNDTPPFAEADPDPEDQFDPPTPTPPASKSAPQPERQPPEPESRPDSAPEPQPEPQPERKPERKPEPAPQPKAAPPSPSPSQMPSAPDRSVTAPTAAAGDIPSDEIRDILRVVTGGLMSLLQGRAEIKNEFRIAQTRFVKTENNPLKFSPDADEALKRILGATDSPGFLTGGRAFEDALDDIQAHQLAMLSAVQRAIESAIAEFDPAELEKKLQRISPISAKTPGLKAAKCWSLFTMHYDEVSGKMRDDARQLFLAEFAEAYEEASRAVAQTKHKNKHKSKRKPES